MRRLLPWLPWRLKSALVRRAFHYKEEELQGVVVKVADTADAYVDAARLVHDGYVARRIMRAHGSGVRMTPYLALPTTVIFVALRDGQLLGTLSLVLDSELKLPMEKAFPDEVAAVRAEGRRPAEVGALCVAPGQRGMGVPFLLYKAMWKTAVELLGVDDLVISVHPTAAPLYEGMLCFERMGRPRQYPGLDRSAVAAALRLKLREAETTFRAVFGHLPKDQHNPLYMYVEHPHPQLELPADARFLEQLRGLRQQATLKLAALRPDIVLELDPSTFETFRRALR